MKNLTSLLKSLLYNKQTKTKKPYETKTNEAFGDYRLADTDTSQNPDDPQKHQGSQESQKSRESQGTGGESGGESGGGSGSAGSIEETPETESSAEIKQTGKTPEIEKALKEAYERGVKDGRNSKIEEMFFMGKDDGIPEFHGYPRQQTPLSDIFSIAREAGR